MGEGVDQVVCTQLEYVMVPTSCMYPTKVNALFRPLDSLVTALAMRFSRWTRDPKKGEILKQKIEDRYVSATLWGSLGWIREAMARVEENQYAREMIVCSDQKVIPRIGPKITGRRACAQGGSENSQLIMLSVLFTMRAGRDVPDDREGHSIRQDSTHAPEYSPAPVSRRQVELLAKTAGPCSHLPPWSRTKQSRCNSQSACCFRDLHAVQD